jgi:hypothetical protein
MANTCTVCNKELSFFENLSQRENKRCNDCKKKFNLIQKHFLQQIDTAYHQNQLSPEREQAFYREMQQSMLPQDLCIPVVALIKKYRNLIVEQELKMVMENHFRAGTLTSEIEQSIFSRATVLPQEMSSPLLKRLRYLRSISEIQRGNVPRIQTTLHLDSDEFAHFDMRVKYYKPNKVIKEIPGRLIGTNKKCYFVSDSGADNATIDWNNVGQVHEKIEHLIHKIKVGSQTAIRQEQVAVLHLSVTKGSGGGGYAVEDRYYTKILIDTLVRLWKRQLVIYAETKTAGSIPEHVKSGVFRRDGGRCVQCGYEGPYIEYDHKYPRSKGGQNTVENIQLLCRMCNLKKGSRV